MPQGSKGRFARCVQGVSRSGSAVDPRAVCAAQEARLYGRKELQRRAAAARKLNARRKPRKPVNYIIGRNSDGSYDLRFKEGFGSRLLGSYSTYGEAESARRRDWASRKPNPGKRHRTNTDPVVSTYQLRAGNGSGRPVRKATQVKFPDGRVVKFIDKLSKREALRQAGYESSRYNPKRRRGNPIESAKDVYQSFHGEPSEHIVKVKTRLHEHGVLSGIGELRKLVIRTPDKKWTVTLTGFKGALLAQNEARTQLFIDGGDQSVNLAEFGIDPGRAHERELLGECTWVYYFTNKTHLGSDGGRATYKHKFGGTMEITTARGKRKRVRSPLPAVIYDVPNRLLEFAGGGYAIPDEGIDH